MSFDIEDSYLDIEVDDIFLELYETEGVRKITELSRQVRTLLNFKTNVIRYRFHSSFKNFLKSEDIQFYDNKRKFESLALKFIRLLNKINGISSKTLEEEIQNLFFQVTIKKNQTALSLLKELRDIIYQLFMKIHYFSEQSLYDHYDFLKTLIQIAIEACKTRKSMDHAFSEFYAELGINYNNLEEELTFIVPENGIRKEKRIIKQLGKELIS